MGKTICIRENFSDSYVLVLTAKSKRSNRRGVAGKYD